MKKRKFKVNDKVKLLWPEETLENLGLDSTAVIVRRFREDYSDNIDNWYYVSNRGSLRLPLFLVDEVNMRRAK